MKGFCYAIASILIWFVGFICVHSGDTTLNVIGFAFYVIACVFSFMGWRTN